MRRITITSVLVGSVVALVALTSPQSMRTWAAITGDTGQMDQIPPPASVCTNGLESINQIKTFNEKQHFRIPTSSGDIAATAPSPKYGGNAAGPTGTVYNQNADLVNFTINETSVVSSHFVHRELAAGGDNSLTGQISFDGDIIAVVITDSHLEDTDPTTRLGVSGTCYPNNLAGRSVDWESDGDYIEYIDANTIEIHFVTGAGLDQLRVVTEANRAPTAGNEAESIDFNTTLNDTIMGNDSDPDGSPLTAELITDVTQGVLVLNPDGTYSYTPANNYVGPDSFTYQVCDPGTTTRRTSADPITHSKLCDTAVVSITVNETDDDGDGVNEPGDNCPGVPNGPAEAAIPGVGNQSDNDGSAGTFDGTVPPASWIHDSSLPQGANTGGDACDANDDNDLRCTDGEELGMNLNQGGMRDPMNPWDFADVPTPSLPTPTAARDGVVSLIDVGAALEWVGRTSTNGTDSEGHNYTHDNNTNAIPDGQEYDRTPGGEISGPPNGAISLPDVGVILAQVGDSCLALPN